MKAADFFKMAYSDNNTNIMSLYLSQMQQSQRSSVARQRDISARISRLETQLGRFRRDYNLAIQKNPERKQNFEILKQNYRERNSLRTEIGKNDRALLAAGVDVASIKQRGQALTLTAQEMKARIEENVRKEWKATPKVKKLAEELDGKATRTQTLGLDTARVDVAGLTDKQKTLFASLLYTKLKDHINLGKPQAIKAAIEEEYGTSVLTNKEIETQLNKDIANATKRIKGTGRELIKLGGKEVNLVTKSKKFAEELKKVQAAVKASEQRLKINPEQQNKINKLRANKDLIAYLEDAKDYQIDGYYTDEKGQQRQYDQKAANEARAELLSIGMRDPAQVPLEEMQLLNRTGYLEIEANKRALEAQMRSIGTDSTLPRMLAAPQFNLFTPIGQINSYIRDMKSGLEKNRLMAGQLAEMGENPEFTRLYNNAAPNQRIVFAVMPMVSDRVKNVKDGKLNPETGIEKKAAQYITSLQTGGKDWSPNLRAPALVDMAENLYGDNETKKAEFITYVLAAQQVKMAPGYTYEKETANPDKIKAAAQKKVVKDIKKEALEDFAAKRARHFQTIDPPWAAGEKPQKEKTLANEADKPVTFKDGSTFQIKTRDNGMVQSYTWTSKDGKQTKTFKVGAIPELDEQAKEAYGTAWSGN